jgi:cytidylate kinase
MLKITFEGEAGAGKTLVSRVIQKMLNYYGIPFTKAFANGAETIKIAGLTEQNKKDIASLG